MIALTADHGESLGEHGYWGHGRNLYEQCLRIPLSVTWPARIRPGLVAGPALLTDLAPTLLGLVGLAVPESFGGFDWSAVLRGERSPPTARVTFYQAHRGAVFAAEERSPEDRRRLRRRGLLEVGRISGGEKEIFRLGAARRQLFDLVVDPEERVDGAALDSSSAPALAAWLASVESALAAADSSIIPAADEEDVRALKALGYLD